MTIKEVIKMLKQLNLPVVYQSFKPGQVPNLPYFIVREDQKDFITTDNEIYYSVNNYEIEFYFQNKDQDFENKIENLFKDNKIIYSVSGDIYISEERFNLKTYSI